MAGFWCTQDDGDGGLRVCSFQSPIDWVAHEVEEKKGSSGRCSPSEEVEG
jgi:hypothetical protein